MAFCKYDKKFYVLAVIFDVVLAMYFRNLFKLI